MQEMGKASKWIRNFLMGKKEEKEKNKDNFSSAEISSTPRTFFPGTPREKRRWSFGRSACVDTTNNKSRRSFDSIFTAPLFSEYENAKKYTKPSVLATDEAVKRELVAPNAQAKIPASREDAAATKIQAFFRAYLARKALSALRGLVKIQALVRGHLVRKQTNAMVRCMHSLMAIQVRARIQRIQMAEEAQLLIKSRTTHSEFSQAKQLRNLYTGRSNKNYHAARGRLKSKSGHMNHLHVEQPHYGLSTYCSGRLSISERDHICSSPSALNDSSTRTGSQKIEEFSLNTTHKFLQQQSPVLKSENSRVLVKSPLSRYPDNLQHDYQFMPNYMAYTESSKAKVRSQSEPKQRPKSSTKQKSRRTSSAEGITVTVDNQMHLSSPQVRHNTQKHPYPWLRKLYRSSKSIKKTECDSISTTTNNSIHGKSLIVCEPPVTLY